jgi:hypothetical protein
MDLEAAILQLKKEIERLKAALSILENLQRKRRVDSLEEAAQRKPVTAKKKPKRSAAGSPR